VSDTVIGSIILATRLSEHLAHRIDYSRQQRSGFQAGVEIVDAVSYGITWHKDLWAAAFQSSYQTVETRLSRTVGYRNWVNQVTASRLLTSDLTLTLATAYAMRQNDSVQAGGVGEDVPSLSNDYDTWVSNVGLTYVLAENWTAYAYAEHLVRYSDSTSLEFTRDTIGLTLVYRYDL
jgi:hypothetical protein